MAPYTVVRTIIIGTPFEDLFWRAIAEAACPLIEGAVRGELSLENPTHASEVIPTAGPAAHRAPDVDPVCPPPKAASCVAGRTDARE